MYFGISLILKQNWNSAANGEQTQFLILKQNPCISNSVQP